MGLFNLNKNIMRFLVNIVEETDRHTEPKVEDVPMGMPMPAKYEEMTVKITLVGSGDTRDFSSREVIKIIMERLEESIDPT